MANSNIINAVFGSGLCAVTTSAFRANYGMKLRLSGIDLPTAFECDFSNYDTMGRDSITMIGQNGEVQIPDQLWDSGLNIYAYVYLHPTDDSGVTVYTVTIPVLGRPNRTEETPTPHEQTVIEQAISALNDAVEQTAADVETTTANAQAAAQSEANASASERAAAASASAALASQNAAESASQSATQSASGAAESARNAAQSTAQAAESATAAQESAEQAERSVQSIGDDVERSERAAQTATEKATEAASSASTASNKATEAGQSATAAAQSAQSASTAAQNAASSEQLAQSHATDAEQAKQDAQDAQEAAEAAQAAAEQAAESVSGLSEQITQNTADIAELVQSKAGALIDTATGSIASFVPDATVPTVKGLTVDVEPVQDLHGYDAPWPAGGGVNKFDIDNITSIGEAYGLTTSIDGDVVRISGTYTGSGASSYRFIYHNQPIIEGAKFAVFRLDTSSARVSLRYASTTDNAIVVELRNVTQNTSVDVKFRFVVYTGATAPTAYSPYSNICPISGWDAVEVVRSGKNLLNQTNEKPSYYETDSDGAVTNTNGTFGWNYANSCFKSTLPAGDYTLIVIAKTSNGASSNTQVWPSVGSSRIATVNNSSLAVGGKVSANFTLSETTDIGVCFKTDGGYNWVMIVNQADSSLSTFVPYSGDTYTIQLGQTVYGGTVDAVQGKMVVDRAMVDLGTLNWAPAVRAGITRFRTHVAGIKRVSLGTELGQILCSNYESKTANQTFIGKVGISQQQNTNDVYIYDPQKEELSASDFKSAMSGVQLVYELATPITVDLTPLEISVLTGQTNNIWADSGDVSVEYAADLKTYINNKIAAAVAALS